LKNTKPIFKDFFFLVKLGEFFMGKKNAENPDFPKENSKPILQYS